MAFQIKHERDLASWFIHGGTLFLLVIGALVILSSRADLRYQRGKIVSEDLPTLARTIERQHQVQFDKVGTGLKLLAARDDWSTLLSQFAHVPAEARSEADRWARILGATAVDILDIQRSLVHAYWSEEPVRLHPELERDSWFFDIWAVESPPENGITLYYDDSIGGQTLYFDQLLRDSDGKPAGVLGAILEIRPIAEKLQQLLSAGEYVYLIDNNETVLLELTRDSFRQVAPVYSVEGVREAENTEFESSPIHKVISQNTNGNGDNRFISQPFTLSVADISGVVVLDTEKHLRSIRRTVFERVGILLASYIVLAGMYVTFFSIYSRRSRNQLRLVTESQNRLDDLLSLLTHNLGNDLHSLRMHLSEYPALRAPDTENHAGYSRSKEPPVDVLLMDMEQVMQNAVYAARLSTDEPTVLHHRIDSAEILERLEVSCAGLAAAKSQRLEIANHAGSEFTVDEDALFHMLLNLTGNAIKFSPFGSTIIVAAIERADHIEIIVADQGPGFSAKDRDRLFEKNARLSARPTGGERSTGIGLYVTAQLARIIGAELHLLETLPNDLLQYRASEASTGAIWSVWISTARNGEK